MASSLISLGLGSPASVPFLLRLGLNAGAEVVQNTDVIVIAVDAYDRTVVVPAHDRTVGIDAYDRTILIPDVRGDM